MVMMVQRKQIPETVAYDTVKLTTSIMYDTWVPFTYFGFRKQDHTTMIIVTFSTLEFIFDYKQMGLKMYSDIQ